MLAHPKNDNFDFKKIRPKHWRCSMWLWGLQMQTLLSFLALFSLLNNWDPLKLSLLSVFCLCCVCWTLLYQDHLFAFSFYHQASSYIYSFFVCVLFYISSSSFAFWTYFDFVYIFSILFLFYISPVFFVFHICFLSSYICFVLLSHPIIYTTVLQAFLSSFLLFFPTLQVGALSCRALCCKTLTYIQSTVDS